MVSPFYTNAFNNIKNSSIENNKPLRDSSIRTYLYNIKKISIELFNTQEPNIRYFKDHETVIEYLESLDHTTTKKNICTAIIMVLRSNPVFMKSPIEKRNELLKFYTDYQTLISNKYNDFYLDNERTEKEKENWVSVEDIHQKISDLRAMFVSSSKNKKTEELSITKQSTFKGTHRQYIDKFQQYLILNLYGPMLPPLRNDYAFIRVTDSDTLDCLDKNFNYINVKLSKMVLNEYKTSKHYGCKVIDIPEELLEIIKTFESIKATNIPLVKVVTLSQSTNQVVKKGENIPPHNYLLVNPTDFTPMTNNGLTKYINKIFKPKKVSTTILRKIYLSNKYPVIHSTREIEKDSYIMGHDPMTARKVYSKFLNK